MSINTLVAVFGEGSGSWTPSRLGSDVFAWYRPENIVSATSWTDEGPNSYDLVSIGADPSTTTLNGYDAMTFNSTRLGWTGSNTYFDTIANTNTFSMFFIGQLNATQNGGIITFNFPIGSGAYGKPQITHRSGGTIGIDDLNSGGQVSLSTSTDVIMTGYGTMGAANYTSSVYKNGYTATINTAASIAFGYANAGVPNIVVGSGESAGGSQFDGNFTVSEILICNTQLSSDNLERVEGYAAHKYGLTSLLPVSHPYKTLAP